MLSRAVLTTIGIALPAAVAAQPISGLYVGLGAGINLLQDEYVMGSPVPTSGKLQSDVGPTAVLSLGWGFGNGLRTEIEGDFRGNKYTTGSGFGVPVTAGGWHDKFGAMANVLYDLNALSPLIVPYVGGGVGYQWVDLQNTTATSAVGSGVTASSTVGSFAYQAIVGAAVPLPSIAPGLALTAEYRFMGLGGHRTYQTEFTYGGSFVPGSTTHTDDYNHSILFGIRYNFGVAPVPAPTTATMPR
jgi:OmpA-OmpF porin, OOP family